MKTMKKPMKRPKKNRLDETLDAYDHFVEKRMKMSEVEKKKAREKAVFFAIDSSNLDEEVKHAAAVESYISTHLAEAKKKEALSYLERKTIQAQKYLEFREMYKRGSEKKTNDEIDAMVMQDQDVRLAHVAHLAAQTVAMDIEGDLSAIRRKSRMLELQKFNIHREQTVKTAF